MEQTQTFAQTGPVRRQTIFKVVRKLVKQSQGLRYPAPPLRLGNAFTTGIKRGEMTWSLKLRDIGHLPFRMHHFEAVKATPQIAETPESPPDLPLPTQGRHHVKKPYLQTPAAITQGHQPLFASPTLVIDTDNFTQYGALLTGLQGRHREYEAAILITTGQMEQNILHPPQVHALQALDQRWADPAQRRDGALQI
jgi:hypothetical protein